MQKSILLSFLALTFTVVEGREPPPVCMLSPLATIKAGNTIKAMIDNPQGRPCVGTFVFANQDFLPITFDLQPTLCLGYQRAEVTVPMEVLNGEVTIIWECAGHAGQSCARAWIDGGEEDVKALKRQQSGRVGCVVPTATVATLVTFVKDGVTTINTALATILGTVEPISLDSKTESQSKEGIVTKTDDVAKTQTATGDSVATPAALDAEAVDKGSESPTLAMVVVTPTSDQKNTPTATNSLRNAETQWSGSSACPCGAKATQI